MAQRITPEQIKASYELAKQVYDGEIAVNIAVNRLVDNYGMNKATASINIQFLKDMLAPRTIKRTVGISHLKYYADRVYKDYGKEKFKTFLKGLEYHIGYRQSQNNSVPGFCKLYNEYGAKIGLPPINEFTSSFPEESIKESSEDEQIIAESFSVSKSDKIAKLLEEAERGILVSKRTGKYMVRVYERNPRKPNSWGHRGYALLKYLEPILYEDYRRKGVRGQDIRYDLNKGFTEIFDSRKEAEAYCEDMKNQGYNPPQIETEDISESYSLERISEDKCFIEEERIKEIFQCLQNKKNMILQGPPGTGKTWLAKRLGYALVGKKSNKQVMSVQFHPNMSYEDFVMGYRPSEKGGLERSGGIFMDVIQEAHKHPDKKYVMVIEEINRGNPVQIFGEMLTLLEADKRDESEALRLPYQNKFEMSVYIPENLYVIGTMNLADRSLAMIDFAFRRRFAFIDLEPQLNDLWLEDSKGKLPKEREGFADEIRGKINELNEEIRGDLSLGKQFCIGHSFVTLSKAVQDPNIWFKEIVNTKIAPLLEEYWFSTFDDNEEGKSKAEVAKEKLLAGL